MRKGILRIVPVIFGSAFPIVGQLALNKDRVYNLPETQEDCLKSAQWFNNKRVHCLVTEPQSIRPIEFGDVVYEILQNTISVANEGNLEDFRENHDDYEAILVHTDEFQKDTLKMIVNKELCDGDSVTVQSIIGENVIEKDNEKKDATQD